MAGSLTTASVDAVSDRFDIAKELLDGSWDHEDNMVRYSSLGCRFV